MSLNRKRELAEIAKTVCRELRKNSTKAENIFWEEVRNRKLSGKKFYRQYPVFHDLTGKETFFVADFYCYEKKLIVELDGSIHQFRLREDRDRTKILNSLGLRVIRIKNEDVLNKLDNVVERIKSIIS